MQVYFSNIEIQMLTDDYHSQIRNSREDQWTFIEGQIKTYTMMAQIRADSIRDNIERELRSTYKDNMDLLKAEIESNNSENKFASILRKNIQGSYLFVENGNNDPFIATLHGIISDLSENSAREDGQERDYKSEIVFHANKAAAEKAISKIVNQDTNDLIIWEFLKSPDKNHTVRNSLNIDVLKEVFLTEGVKGLSTYEFLTPSYIRKYSDIFGVPNISTSGYKIENNKIIIVQGFNIVDQLKHSHWTTMALYEKQEQQILQNYNSRKVTKQVICIGFSACLLITFLSIVKIMNMEVTSSE